MKFAVLKCVSTGGVTPAYSCHKIARMSEAFGEVLHSITHESLPFNFFNIGSNDCSKLFSEGGEGVGRGGVRDGALVCPVSKWAFSRLPEAGIALPHGRRQQDLLATAGGWAYRPRYIQAHH